MPVRNGAATIRAALGSVLRQRGTGFECLIVDDGSTDETQTIVAPILADDRRVRWLRSPGVGLVAALNAGIEQCRGRYIARMDADDLMHRDRLSVQQAQLEKDRLLAGVGSHVHMFPRHGLTEGRLTYESWLNGMTTPEAVHADRLIECPLAHPTLFLRADILKEFGYTDQPWAEDHDLILRLLHAGHRLGVTRRRLLAWRDHPQRASRQDPRYAEQQFINLKAAHLAEGFLAARPTYVLWGYGSTGRNLRAALVLHRKSPAFIVELHQGRLHNRIHGALVVPPEVLPSLPRLPIVVSVAGKTPRQQIRGALHTMGFDEGRDYVVTA